jgi:hypothetical protein
MCIAPLPPINFAKYRLLNSDPVAKHRAGDRVAATAPPAWRRTATPASPVSVGSRYTTLRGADQLLPLAARHGVRGLGVGWTRFDPDNSEDTAALRHNIDFTGRAPRAARQNSDAAQSDSANHLRRQACRRSVFDIMSPHRPVFHWRWQAPGDKRPGAKRRLLPRPPLQRRAHSYPPGRRATIRRHRNPPRLLPAARR